VLIWILDRPATAPGGPSAQINEARSRQAERKLPSFIALATRRLALVEAAPARVTAPQLDALPPPVTTTASSPCAAGWPGNDG